MALVCLTFGCQHNNSPEQSPPQSSQNSNATLRPAVKAPGNTISGDTIKIGFVNPETGELSPWGMDTANGVNLAVREINKAGGVRGKQIELMMEDSASMPEQAKSAAEKLISEGAVAIIGELGSGNSAQIALAAYDGGVPVVAIGSTKPDLTKIGQNVFRMCFTDAFQGPVMAKFTFDELVVRRVALMTDKKQPYSTGLSDGFKKYFEEFGGKVVAEQFYESGQTEFTPQLTNVRAFLPEAIFISGYFMEVGPIIRQATESGTKNFWIGGDGWDNRYLFDSAGSGLYGSFFCTHFNVNENRKVVKDFLSLWRHEYRNNPATVMGPLGYDAVYLIADAIRRATTLDSHGIISALDNTVDLHLVTGRMTLKGNQGDPKKRAVIVECTPKGNVFRKAYEYEEIMR